MRFVVYKDTCRNVNAKHKTENVVTTACMWICNKICELAQRIKLLHYETGGIAIYAKALDRGTFGMPIAVEKAVL